MSSSSETSPDTIMVSAEQRSEAPHNSDTVPVEAPAGGNQNVPKPKRLACQLCRKRKLRCDGLKPSCSTCARLGHKCVYDEVRRKSGPKRGYVKALEERLKQVETLLKNQELSSASNADGKGLGLGVNNIATPSPNQRPAGTPNFGVTDPALGMSNSPGMDRWRFAGNSPHAPEDFNFSGNVDMGLGVDPNLTMEMISLGLEEPLPTQETIDELHQIYFEKIHPSVPMIHRYRYLAAMNLAPTQRPPVCLRYAMWTLACSVSENLHTLKDLFYQRARKYLESDYIKGYGEHMISVAHAQTHILLAVYEFKWMYFPRAWMSTGSGVRLAQMIGLHRVDGAGLDVKQCLPPARDWTEREERRRTFWMAFCLDRFASIGTGWPLMIDEKDISTNLPTSEEAFELSRTEQTSTLEDAMTPAGAGRLSPFGSVVLMACLFGRNLMHLHRPNADDRDDDLNGEFWKRHRQMDNILLNTSLCLPSSLKLPNGLGNPNVVFTNMCIHTSTICLHQAAIFKADKNRLPASVSSESKVRCITAANEIASIMRMISHLDLSSMNPFIAFCLYVSARVFIQYLKSRPDDSKTADSLRFLLSAMNALKRRNPLTESFLVQLDVDLEALGVRIPKLRNAFPRSTDSPSSPNQMPPGLANRSKNPGIFGYSNECHYMKVPNDDGNPATAPDLIEVDPVVVPDHGFPSPNMPHHHQPSTTTLPTRERSQTASSFLSTHHNMMHPSQYPSFIPDLDTAATSGTDLGAANTPDGPSSSSSNRPTPGSSTTASEHHPQHGHTLTPGSNLPATNGSARTSSFDTSPALVNTAGPTTASSSATAVPTTTSELNRSIEAFFSNDPSAAFGNGDTRGANGAAAGGAGGWPDMTAGTGVAEGMLRSMIGMEGIEISWDGS